MKRDLSFKCRYLFDNIKMLHEPHTELAKKHIFVIIAVSADGLAIAWTSADLLLIEPLGTNFSEIWIQIQPLSLKKKILKNGCCSTVCPGLNL